MDAGRTSGGRVVAGCGAGAGARATAVVNRAFPAEEELTGVAIAVMALDTTGAVIIGLLLLLLLATEVLVASGVEVVMALGDGV